MAIRIIGTGSYVPPTVVSNQQMVDFLGEYPKPWTADRITQKTGVVTRRHVFPLGKREADATATPDTDFAFQAATSALENAGMPANKVDGLIYVTCTPDELHFSACANLLHHRLGLPSHAFPMHMNSGCGGVMAAVGATGRIINGGCTSILIVASNAPSAFLEQYRYTQLLPGKTYTPALGCFLFGDGAGAILLRSEKLEPTRGGKILASFYGADTSHPLMYYRGGGAMQPTTPANAHQHIYEIDAVAVAENFGPLMQRAYSGLQTKNRFELSDISRFYFHQANLRLIEGLAETLGLPMEKIAVNADKYANTSAASTLLLFDEDIKVGRVKAGDLMLFCAVGAGAHFGAFLVQW